MTEFFWTYYPDTLVLVALAAYLVLSLAEWLGYLILAPEKYDGKNALSSLSITMGNVVLRFIIAFGISATTFNLMSQHALFDIPMAWWSFVLMFLGQELIWYVDHRLSHRVGILWAFHHVHHSSERLNFTTAARGFIWDGLFRILFGGVMAFLGFGLEQFLIMLVILDVVGIFSHNEWIGKLGWLDRHFATPANHRVHHASNPEYIDRNYGHVLMLFDRWFGTFTPETTLPKFGVTDSLGTENPLKVYVGGFGWLRSKMARAEGFDKWRCLWKPPEWPPRRKPSAGAGAAPAE